MRRIWPPRLVIDARMLGYSGIGAYLTNVLPGVLSRCAALDPSVIVLPGRSPSIDAVPPRSLVTWNAKPLTLEELSKPPVPRGTILWWAPHFNVPLRCSAPLIVTLHDLLPLVDPRTSPIRKAAVKTWLTRIRSKALRVICVSEFTRRHATEIAGINAKITSVIPLGVRVAPCRSTASEAPYLLVVGLLKPHKNLGALARAFERIASRIPHRLVIVGKQQGLRDVDRDALSAMARLGPRVEFHEHVSDQLLWNLLCGADMLVQPSLFEGFGLPPLEAMSAGTPVLAARAGALPEVCGDAAWYCDPTSEDDIAAQILELAGNPALRSRLGAAGRRRAAEFSWARCADSTADVILHAAEALHVVGIR
jgi:glycosyltransferase involved in cell wall biosynthesis